MTTKYRATEHQYRTSAICRAAHDAGHTEAQTIETLCKEVERLSKELIKERSAPHKLLIINRATS